MLSKKRRIQRRIFPEILSKGKRYNSPHLLLYMYQINKAKPSRFAFSVSKKVYKNAVDRNRLRRQGYSIISKYISDIIPGFLFFISFKKGIYPISSIDLEKEIKSILPLKV